MLPPKDTPLSLNLKGKNIVKRISKPGSSTARKKLLFDPFSVETESEKFDYSVHGANETKVVIQEKYPSLYAMKNTKMNRPQTSKIAIRKPIMQFEADNHPFTNTSMITRRNPVPLRQIPAVLTKPQEIIEKEEREIAFPDDPLAYFSKHKDGRGHRFIYLNFAKDRNDPSFNPYELVKTTSTQLNQEYFIMSGDGVSHIYEDGTTENTPLPKWANEASNFASLRKLKLFALYPLWKPFIQWKVYIMNMRYDIISQYIQKAPYFHNIGFAQTQMNIILTYLDSHQKYFLEDVVKKYLLAFKPQSQYVIPAFNEKTNENGTTLFRMYNDYVLKIARMFLDFDATVRDPKKIIVKDTDIKTFRRRNPNLDQLMVLEKKKAEKRIKRTNIVNAEILSYANYIRCLDYYMLESMAQAVVQAYYETQTAFRQKQSSIFQVEVVFTEDGNVKLQPSLDDLKDTVQIAFDSALSLVNSLPRLIMLKELRPHIKQSIPDFRTLAQTGPNILKILDRYTEINEIEDEVIQILIKSYNDAIDSIQIFKELYPIYKLESTWKIESFITTSSGKPSLPLDYQLTPNDNQEYDIQFDVEPIIDLKRICEDADLFLVYEKKIQDLVPCSVAGALYIESKVLRKKLEPIPQAKFQTIFRVLKELLSGKSTRIFTMLSTYKTKLQNIPSSLEQYVSLCKVIVKIQGFIEKIEEQLKYIDELFITFVKYNMSVEGAKLQPGNSLHITFQAFQKSLENAIATREQLHDQFKEELLPQATEIEEKISQYTEMASKIPVSIELCNMEILTATVAKINHKIQKIKPQVQRFIDFQKTLKVDSTNFSSLDNLIKITKFVEKLYQCVERWIQLDTTYIRNVFSLIDVDNLSDAVLSLEADCNTLVADAPFQTTLLDDLLSKLKIVSPYLSQLRLLSLPEMQVRHWNQLFEECKIKNIYKQDMRVDELLMCGIMDFNQKIEEIADIAQREEKAETEFNAIFKHWKAVYLPVLPNQPKVEDHLLIGDTSQLLLNIDDAVISLERMLALPFAQGIEEKVNDLLKQLNEAINILNIWKTFQDNWSFLRALFNNDNSKVIQSSLSVQYNSVRRRWSVIVNHIYKDSSLLAVCSMQGLCHTLTECNSILINILSNLRSFAENKINAFPRLFVLGTNDIVSLAAVADVESVRRIAARVFMRCSSLVLVDNKNPQRMKVKGIESVEGHQLLFQKIVSVQGTLEHWLGHVVEYSSQSLQDSIALAYSKLQFNLEDWIFSFPLHVVYLVLSASFTEEVETCFNSDNPPKSLSQLKDRYSNKKADLINFISSKLTPMEFNTQTFVITVLCNHLSILDELEKTSTPRNLWDSFTQLKYHSAEKKLEILFGGHIYEFDNEFWGKFKPLVRMQATKKVMSNILGSEMPLIIGSASTGRKTSIQQAAVILGKFVFFSPAYSTISTFQMKQILHGSVMSGAWCVFKDINSLPHCILLTISDFIQQYKNSVYLGQSTMNFDSQTIGINNKTRFLFLDEGNSAKIPIQLRKSLQKITLTNPNLQTVLEILLASNGFRYPDSVAAKLTLTITTIGQVLQLYLKTPAAYGNGIKIIRIAATMRIEAKEANQKFNINGERSIEEFIAAKATYQYYGSLIDQDAHNILIKLLYDGFRSHDTFDLFKSILTSSSRSKLDVTLSNIYTIAYHSLNTTENVKKYLSQRIIDLYNLLLYNRCVIVHGATNTGKELIIQTLVKSVDTLVSGEYNEKIGHIRQFKIHQIFHAATPWETTFGSPKNEGTPEEQWENGILNNLLNSINEHKDDYVHLIVFDGPLTPQFNEFIVELAQSRFSRLQSLDSIDMDACLKIIVVTDTLSSFTPLMISCCSMIQMTPVGSLKRSERTVDNLDLIKYKRFPRAIIDTIGDRFDKLLNQVTSYVFRFSDLSFNKLVPDPDTLCFIMSTVFPDFTARYLNSLIEKGEIGANDRCVTSAFVIASARFFDGILNPTISLQFNTWLQNSFNVNIDTNWSKPSIYEDFKAFVPRPLFIAFNPGFVENQLIDISTFSTASAAENDGIIDPRTVLIPTVSILYNYETIKSLINGHCDVCVIGKETNTLIRYFISKATDYNSIIFTINSNTTTYSLINQIKQHSDIFNKKVKAQDKRAILIFEDLDKGPLEIQELLRQMMITNTITQTPTASKAYQPPIPVVNTSIIVTSSSLQPLTDRFVTKFATIFSKPPTPEECIYILRHLFLRNGVSPEFTEKVIKTFNDLIQSIPDFPQSIRALTRMIYTTIMSKSKKMENPSDEQQLVETLFFEVITRFKPNPEKIGSIFQKYFRVFTSPKSLDFNTRLTRIQYVATVSEKPYTTCTFEDTNSAISDIVDYIEQFNAASAEKVPLYISSKLIIAMTLLQRSITFPHGNAILIGKECSGRYTASRIMANVCKYDFVQLYSSGLDSTMKEIITMAVVYSKKFALYIRSTSLDIPPYLSRLITFDTTLDFSIFFSDSELTDFYSKAATTYKLNLSQKNSIRETIKRNISINIHFIISRDVAAVPLPWDEAIQIDFQDYEAEDLQEITQRTILSENNKKIFGSFGGLLPKFFVKLHTISKEFDASIHPNSYFDFIRTFNDVLVNKYNEKISLLNARNSAINFITAVQTELIDVSKQMDEAKRPLDSSKDDLDTYERTYNSKLDAVRTMDDKVNTQKAIKEKQLKQLEEQASELKERVQRCHKRILDTQKEIDKFTENDIATIRIGAENPTYSFMKTFEIICMFMNYHFSYEIGGVKLINDPNFLNILHGGIEYDNLQQAVINTVDQYFKDPQFTRASVDEISPPVLSLYDWVYAIELYAKEQKVYLSAYTQYLNYERAYNEFINEIESQQASINHVRETIDEDKKRFEQAKELFNKLNENYSKLQKRKDACDAILKDTDWMIKKWQGETTSTVNISKRTIVESILISYYLSYCGRYSKDKRQRMVLKVTNELMQLNLTESLSSPYRLIKDAITKEVGTDKSTKGPTYKLNLPKLHAMTAPRIPLILKSNGIFNMDVSETFKHLNVDFVSVYNSDFEYNLADAIESGKTLIVTDVDNEPNEVLFKLFTAYQMRNDESANKTISIANKGIKWNPTTHIILTSTKKHVDQLPLSLRYRTTIIKVTGEVRQTVRKLIENKFVAIYDAKHLKQYSQAQMSSSAARVNSIQIEEQLIRAFAEMAKIAKKKGLQEALSDDINTVVTQYKTELIESDKESTTLSDLKTLEKESVEIFKTTISHILIYWVAIQESLERINDSYTFSFQSFLTLVVNVLKMPGIQRDHFVEDIGKMIDDTIPKQILAWMYPMFSPRDILIYMFTVAFYFNVQYGHSSPQDMRKIFTALKEIRTKFFDDSNSDPLGEPISILKANVPPTSVYSLVSRAITAKFGNDSFNQIPVFQPESVLMQVPNTPVIILSEAGKDPIAPIMQYVSTRSKNDTLENISLSTNLGIIKRAKKAITVAVARGNRLLIHCDGETPEILSFLSDIYKIIQSSTVNSNFRVIFCLAGFTKIPQLMLKMSKRLFYDDQIYSFKHIMNVFFSPLTYSFKTYSQYPAMKKICYSAALSLSILMQRKLLGPISFDDEFIFNENTFNSFLARIKPTFDVSKNIPVNIIRDIFTQTILSPSTISPLDQRKIESLISKIFIPAIIQDNFFFVGDDNEPGNKCLKIPDDFQVSSFSQMMNSMPLMIPTSGLLMEKNIATIFRNWTLSSWLIEGILAIEPMKIAEDSASELFNQAKKFSWSLPEPLPLPSLVSKTAIGSVMRFEIVTLDELINEMKDTLSSTTLTQNLIDFVHNKIPQSWVEQAGYYENGSSEDFLDFITKKHHVLYDWITSHSITRVDISLIKNVKGLLHAYQLDTASNRGLSADKTILYFDTSVERDGKELVFTNLKIIGAYWNEEERQIEVKKAPSAITKFPDLTVRVMKKTNITNKLFLVPLLKEPVPHTNNLHLTDGLLDNIIYMIPLPSDVNQITLTANGVALLASTPKYLTPKPILQNQNEK